MPNNDNSPITATTLSMNWSRPPKAKTNTTEKQATMENPMDNHLSDFFRNMIFSFISSIPAESSLIRSYHPSPHSNPQHIQVSVMLLPR